MPCSTSSAPGSPDSRVRYPVPRRPPPDCASLGIPVLDLNDVDDLGLYIDGADEANPRLQLIKGGGAALTREKIIAAAARTFVCIADETKLVADPGPIPPAGGSHSHGTRHRWRANWLPWVAGRSTGPASSPTTATTSSMCTTSSIEDPLALETDLNQISRRGHGWPVRAPPGRCAAAGHRRQACAASTAPNPQGFGYLVVLPAPRRPLLGSISCVNSSNIIAPAIPGGELLAARLHLRRPTH